METILGYPVDKWNEAKEETRAVLIATAKRRGMITYSELVKQVTAVRLHFHEPATWEMLGEISVEENAAGRGMLSVIVVHKHGDMEPGPGFFNLAEVLNRDITDKTKFWIEEVKKVYKVWSIE